MSARPITDTLRLLQGGLFIDKASELLAQIVRGVDETGKAGRLTVVLDIKKAGGAVSVLAAVSDKTPEAAPDVDLFWPTVEGNLSVDNPAQRKLDLRVADGAPGPVREVIDQSTGEVIRTLGGTQ